MRVVIAVALVMTVLVRVASMFVRVLAVFFDDELRGGNAGAQYARRRDPRAFDRKAAERAPQQPVLRMLEFVVGELRLDALVATAIERGARARHRRVE